MDGPLPPVSPPLTRETLTQRILAALADNTSQLITPEDIRSRLLEMVDSTVLRTDEAAPDGGDGDSQPSLSTKSPYLDWRGAPALSLGTSIPHQGGSLDSYLGIAMAGLGGTLKNMAWSGSHARYDVLGSPSDINTIKCLSMTEDDRQAGLALYGPSSVYDDSFDVVNKASQMTCDYRIDQQFALVPYKVVFFDHNCNDRNPDFYGSAGPFETINIVSITKGATTQVTLASIGSIAVGDGVVIQLVGIDKLNHAAQRVQARSGNTITLNIDSASYAGTFSTGTCTKYDRATLHGSFRFLYHRIKRAGALAGVDPLIIYNGAPSNYFNGAYDADIRASAELIASIADELGCAFFDEAGALAMSLDWQSTYFPDTVHPLEAIQRKAIANLWAEWLAGGATPLLDPDAFVPAPAHDIGEPPVYADQSPLIYSRFLGGAGTPDMQVGDPVVAFSDDFASGLGTWTSNGAAPVFGAAPWGSGQAIQCVVNNNAGTPSSYLSRSISLGRGRVVEFDFYLPDVVGQSTSPTAQVSLFELRSTGGYYVVSLRVSTVNVSLFVSYFETSNTTLHRLSPDPEAIILADTKYRLRCEMVQGSSADDPGRLLVYLDGVLIGGPYALADFGQAAIGAIRLGAISSNTGQAFTVYHGNLVVSNLPIGSLVDRVTGTLSGIDFVGGWAVGGAGISTLPITTGTWTPAFAFTTPGDSVITHTVQTGKWLKIGGFVLIMMDLAFNTSAYTTAAGNADISGLPFAAAVMDGAMVIGTFSLITYTANAQDVRLRVVSGGTTLRVQLTASNAAFANAGVGNFPASKTGIAIRASGVYWTNA